MTSVAEHPRCFGRRQRIVNPEHFEPVFERKPRARTMVYRDWLVALGPSVAAYVQRLCQRRYQEMDQQIAGLYALAKEAGTTRLVALVEQALEQDAVGVEYLQRPPLPRPLTSPRPALRLLGPTQAEVERDLAYYEGYVANSAAAVAVNGSVR